MNVLARVTQDQRGTHRSDVVIGAHTHDMKAMSETLSLTPEGIRSYKEKTMIAVPSGFRERKTKYGIEVSSSI